MSAALPSISSWLRHMRRTLIAINTHAPGAANVKMDVPCGSCTACCRSPKLLSEVYPGDPRYDWYDKMPRPDVDEGRYRTPNDGCAKAMVLRKHEDGRCIYLRDAGCSIWDWRPQSCRTFDCRMYTFTGAKRDDGVPPAGKWGDPLVRSYDERVDIVALLMACEEIKKFDEIKTAEHQVNMGIVNYKGFRGRAARYVRKQRRARNLPCTGGQRPPETIP